MITISGVWTLTHLPVPVLALEKELRALAASEPLVHWDLSRIERLDSVGALLLWRIWGRVWPERLLVSDSHRHVLERVEQVQTGAGAAAGGVAQSASLSAPLQAVLWLGQQTLGVGRHLRDGVALVGAILLDLAGLLARPGDIPWREFSATLYKAGVMALPVIALVGFLIGIVLSYLSSLQLRLLGAEPFIVNILGMSIIRELGPVLVAILVAGRSGSAMTAQIGVMRVTEEIDALATLGVSRTLRLVLPKVMALSFAMPLLVAWGSAMALLGGMLAAHVQLDLSWGFFLDTLPRSVPLSNLWIGLGKGFVFGVLIGLIACHFGLRVLPNTESLSNRTTSAVVVSITAVILVDAIFAVLTRRVGLPL